MPRQLKDDRRKRKPEQVEEQKPTAENGRCPDCGSMKVAASDEEAPSKWPWPFNLLFDSLAPRREECMRCQYCGHRWQRS